MLKSIHGNIATLAGTTLFLVALAWPVRAQNLEKTPNISALESRLNDDRVLFNATVDKNPGDDLLERGRLVAMGGAEKGGAGMACITCHGANGGGDGAGVFPRLAGLPAWYAYKQLKDYASGARPNEIMSGIANRLTENEKEAVSSYYAVVEAPWPRVQTRVNGRDLQWGGQLAAVGSAQRGIPACVNCHGPRGTGAPPSVPFLAGQFSSYIVLQLQLWKDGVRDNDPMNVMSAIAKKMSEADMQAVGDYYERVRPMAVSSSGK